MKGRLVELALKARENSYSPYSGYSVGAALLSSSGRVYTGCNVENASFTPTVCAERTAFFKAVSEGEKNFVAIAVVGGREDALSPSYPCGVCRQVMREFCDDGFRVIVVNGAEIEEYTLAELLPRSFSKLSVDIEKLR